HRLLDPRLMQRQDVGVSLHDNRPTRLGDRRFRPVDPVQQLALVEEVGLRRVDVLGALVGAHRAAAEAEGATAAAAGRGPDPRPEAVVLTATPPALREADTPQLLDAEAGPLPAQEDRVPGTRREADPEPPQHLLSQATLGEVVACFPGLLRVP